MAEPISRFGSAGSLRRRSILVLAATLVASAGWGNAEAPAAGAPAPPTPSAAQGGRPETKTPRGVAPDEFGRGTPRGTIAGFLSAAGARDYTRAASYLDLSYFPGPEAARLGPTLARHLRVVLDQTLLLHPHDFSDDPADLTDDGQPPSRDVVGRIQTKWGAVTLLLERVPREDGVPVWDFSAGTVARIPFLYDIFGHGPMGEFLPPVFLEIRPLEVALWQWIALLCLVPVSFLVAWMLLVPGLKLVRFLLWRGRLSLAPQLAERVAAPLCLLVAVALFHLSRRALYLAVAVQPTFATVEEIVAVVAASWLILLVIAVVAEKFRQDTESRGQLAMTAVVELAQRGMTLVVLTLALLSVLEVVGVHVTALIAGLGVGGIAIALAAQKTIEHLFGGVTIVADQPVKVGDFCRFGDKLGTVEWIGLRSTRIRTLDRTLLSIPNGDFAALQIENFAARDRIWLNTTLNLDDGRESDIEYRSHPRTGVHGAGAHAHGRREV